MLNARCQTFLLVLAALAASPTAQTIRVLFWGGTATATHNARALRDTLTPVFAANGMQLNYREAATHSWLHPDSLAQYDVALLYTTNQTGTDLTATQLNNLVNWVASGRVIVAFHGSTNTYLNNGTVSAGWRQLLGAQFLDHDSPNNCGTITFTQPGHSALAGTSPLPASGAATGSSPYWDEGRRHNQYVSDTVVIARAQLGTTNAPWIWVRPQGLGFVYYNASGHDGQVWRRAEWKGQVVRALQWGAHIKTTGIRGRHALQSLLRAQGGELFMPFRSEHSIEILDMRGRRVFFRGLSSAASHDVSFLPAGTYGVNIFPDAREAFKGLYIKAR